MKKYIFVFSVLVAAFSFHPDISARGQEKTGPVSLKLDIVLVLDNSGSMKKNDPEFMTKKVVTDFFKGLSGDARIGFVIFGERSELAMPLTPVAGEGTKGVVEKTLARVNYTGKYSNIPAAIERALYELKQNGRKDAGRLIVFMTDGFIDTGAAQKDVELGTWLKEVLTKDAKDAGIRIFSIAFSEDADYELIQTIAVKTGGGYYRAIKKEDLQNVFNNIQQVILKPQQSAEQKVDEVGFSRGLLVVAVIGLIVLGIIAIIVTSKREKKPHGGLVEKEEAISTPIPAAVLEDVGKITGKEEHKISKKEITIGRGDDKGSSVDIAIPQNTVSGVHATIEYKDNNFYVTDQRSTNKTYLNNQAIPPGVPQRLKSGDMIAFDRFKFKFFIQEQIGKGGTILRPAAAGGTILRPQASPEIKPQQPAREAAPPHVAEAEEGSTEGTMVKAKFCEIHPSFNASELCPVCKKGYCSDCMVEKDGRKICSRCAQNSMARS